MATQTETYKLNKPARTDRIDIDLLNENMDTIEQELKKRPLSSDVVRAGFYDLDLSSWVTVEFAGYNLDSNATFTANDDSNLPGGAAAFLNAVASGSLPRIKLKDNNGARFIVVLGVCETSTDGAKNITNCTGTMADAVYDVIDSFRLKIEETSGEYAVTFYASRKVNGAGTVKTVNGAGPDENGNVEVPTAEGTVKFVNGIAPDETGNAVLLSTTGLSIDWTNGTYTETLSDGTSHTEDIEFNTDGIPTKFGSMAFSITGG